MRASRWMRYVVLALLSAGLVALGPAPAAQAADVTLSGVITNGSGTPVDGGRLRVRAVGGQTILFSATSNASGQYSVTMPAGNYDLTFLGAPNSGLLARAPNTPVPVSSTFDAQVTSQAITLTVTVTAPYTQHSTDGQVYLFQDPNTQLQDKSFRHGIPQTFTVLPGSVNFYLQDRQQTPPLPSFVGLNAQTTTTLYEEDTHVDLDLPYHFLTVHAEDVEGNPVSGLASWSCDYFGAPAGWKRLQVSADLVVPTTGADLLFIDSDGASCDVTFDPDVGPLQTASLSTALSSHTFVVGDAIHLTGTVSDGAGSTNSDPNRFIQSYGPPNEQGIRSQTGEDANDDNVFDLEVTQGQHQILAAMQHIGPFEELQVETALAQYLVDTVVDVAPVRHVLTVAVRTSSGDPVQATASLRCRGKPLGQTAISNQQTYDVSSGTDVVLYGADSTYGGPGDPCILEVTPTTGTPVYLSPFHFTDGETKTIVVDPGVTISGSLTLPGITTYGPFDARVNITSLTDEGVAVQVPVQPDGTFVAEHAPKGDVTVRLTGNPPGWPTLFREFRLEDVAADVTGLDVSPALDDLTVYLLDAAGNDATATLQLYCQPRRVGQPTTSSQTTVTVRSGTGVVTIPGFAANDDLPCNLLTTFASSLVVSANVKVALGGSTITQVEAGSVTLPGSPTASNDLDGVADALEAYAPNTGDGDDDGNPDYEQEDVASLPENGGGLGSSEDFLTVAGPDGKALTAVSTAPTDTPPPASIDLPDGVVDFTVDGVTPGSSQQFTIHVPSTSGIHSFATYDPGPTPGTGTWSQLPAADVDIDPGSITVTVKDNGPFDRDPVAGKVRLPGGGTKLEIDVTAPSVSLKGPKDGATYTVGSVPVPQCTASDGGLGVDDDGCRVSVSGANKAGVGTVKVVAKATDVAGNVATKKISYQVRYKPGPLAAPAVGRLKVFKKGATVVVRLKLMNSAGAAVAPARAPAWVKPTVAGKNTKPVNQPVKAVKPDKGTVLVKRGQFWEFRWGTAKAKKGKKYLITVRLDDGTTRTATVGIG